MTIELSEIRFYIINFIWQLVGLTFARVVTVLKILTWVVNTCDCELFVVRADCSVAMWFT